MTGCAVVYSEGKNITQQLNFFIWCSSQILEYLVLEKNLYLIYSVLVKFSRCVHIYHVLSFRDRIDWALNIAYLMLTLSLFFHAYMQHDNSYIWKQKAFILWTVFCCAAFADTRVTGKKSGFFRFRWPRKLQRSSSNKGTLKGISCISSLLIWWIGIWSTSCRKCRLALSTVSAFRFTRWSNISMKCVFGSAAKYPTYILVFFFAETFRSLVSQLYKNSPQQCSLA